MLRLVVRVLLTAVLFCFIFPKIASGVDFHGDFWPAGVIFAAVFAVIAHLINIGIQFGARTFTRLTCGLGLLVVIPALIFGFWLIPAIQLQVVAHYFPEQFTIAGWGSAIWAGLLLMVVNMVTGTRASKSSRS